MKRLENSLDTKLGSSHKKFEGLENSLEKKFESLENNFESLENSLEKKKEKHTWPQYSFPNLAYK